MKLIVGLGNPGEKYNNTRHNVGFIAVEKLVTALAKEAQWEASDKFKALFYKSSEGDLMVVKPQTFMNLSGKAVRYWLDQERLSPEQLLVVADDLALPFGKVRLRAAGGAGGHNGLTNIIELIGTEGFPRLRFGIGNDFARGRQSEFVLGRWSVEEEKELPDRIEQVGKAILQFGLLGIADAMNHFNKR